MIMLILRQMGCGMKRCAGFSMTYSLTFLYLFCLDSVLLCNEANCSRSFQVHWNTTNSIFRIDNTDHIFDVNKGNVQFEYDQVNIICPVYGPGTFVGDIENYIIYNVSKEEYETCRITNPNPRIIAICDKPFKLMYFTITFRPFTPQPGGLEFQPGKDYYFISTSAKDDLHRRIGGRCSSHNMKIVFKVCCVPTTNQNNTTLTYGITSSTRIIVPYLVTTEITTSYSTTLIIPMQDRNLPKYTTKKSHEYDQHPNDVVKNEELTYNKGILTGPSLFLALILTFSTIAYI